MCNSCCLHRNFFNLSALAKARLELKGPCCLGDDPQSSSPPPHTHSFSLGLLFLSLSLSWDGYWFTGQCWSLKLQILLQGLSELHYGSPMKDDGGIRLNLSAADLPRSTHLMNELGGRRGILITDS